jgi:hypothetical protein
MTEAEAIRVLLYEAEGCFWEAENHSEPISGVTFIDLGDSEITDEALELLRHFPRLQWLCLEDTRISDYGLHSLVGLVSLTRIELQGTMVTENGIAMLQKSLPACEIDW